MLDKQGQASTLAHSPALALIRHAPNLVALSVSNAVDRFAQALRSLHAASLARVVDELTLARATLNACVLALGLDLRAIEQVL